MNDFWEFFGKSKNGVSRIVWCDVLCVVKIGCANFNVFGSHKHILFLETVTSRTVMNSGLHFLLGNKHGRIANNTVRRCVNLFFKNLLLLDDHGLSRFVGLSIVCFEGGLCLKRLVTERAFKSVHCSFIIVLSNTNNENMMRILYKCL